MTRRNPNAQPRHLTQSEAARALGISQPAAARAVAAGKLRVAHRVGTACQIEASEVERYRLEIESGRADRRRKHPPPAP